VCRISCCSGQAFTYLRGEVLDSRDVGSRAKSAHHVTHIPDTAR
jgi:hypothetical protein